MTLVDGGEVRRECAQRVRVDVADRDRGLEAVDLDASQLLGVVGAEAACRADLIERVLVGGALLPSTASTVSSASTDSQIDSAQSRALFAPSEPSTATSTRLKL